MAYMCLCVQTAICYVYISIFPHHNYHDRSTESPGDMQSTTSEVCLATTPLWTLELVQGGKGVLEVTKPPRLKKKQIFFLIIAKNLARIQNEAIWNVLKYAEVHEK